MDTIFHMEINLHLRKEYEKRMRMKRILGRYDLFSSAVQTVLGGWCKLNVKGILNRVMYVNLVIMFRK